MDMRVPIFVNSPGGGAEQRLKPALDVQIVEFSWKAVDTVTNFSTMIPVLLAAYVSEVFLVTSDYHMHRAAAVASVMLGGRGIQFVEHVVCSDKHQERVMKIVRDVSTSMALAYHRLGFEEDRAQTDSASTAWFSAGAGKDNALEQLVLFWCLSVLFSNYNCKDNRRADP